ncbi:hypothetical protein V5N11_028660 [Cardamine amara subsp. amara]|uniref:Uncharacterized protein n=1 Tax=Cardamine amara subsp. amara TaxID=228776 RepID=A0ABD0Z1P6_CARAN
MNYLMLHGRRSLELQRLCNSRVAVKHVKNTSATYVSPEENFIIASLFDIVDYTRKFVEYLISIEDEDDEEDPDSVLNLVRSRHRFKDYQIKTIITTCYPRLLMPDSEKSFGQKLDFLQSRGVSLSSELTYKNVSKVPKTLKKNSISLYYDFVRDILMDEEGRGLYDFVTG